MKARPLEHRTAFITGASSGIGRGLALWFAKRDVRVYAAARRTRELQSLQDEAAALGKRIEPVTLDVTDAKATVHALEAADDACGGIDLVVANAGVGTSAGGPRNSFASVERMILVNVLGASATLHALLPRMLERRRGHLVGISSLAALRGLPRSSAYSATKAYLSTLLESLRVDLEPKGLHVTCIQPGYVKSELTQDSKKPLPFLVETQDAVDRMGQAIVLGKPVLSFPWQLTTLLRTLRAMPDAAYVRAARRFM